MMKGYLSKNVFHKYKSSLKNFIFFNQRSYYSFEVTLVDWPENHDYKIMALILIKILFLEFCHRKHINYIH